jgi:hypothetical protein
MMTNPDWMTLAGAARLAARIEAYPEAAVRGSGMGTPPLGIVLGPLSGSPVLHVLDFAPPLNDTTAQLPI